ncbi:uncharacterized protein A1O9_11541 [Exophiala aquamarina CBS 119918]|uniref:NmrA-like domain-containing protein n=1 Tax=Exophiala aquamarina CBS 119918 TaxID=1182545 RepID=A0A072NXK8_9EURO|nr:uncharacterized protein A1O9_11541 [Exophiala aquamarina CBS 119918]KEF52301.1 hypothetical protein A1O9_11541 [Exophiala aquamarina CBS 119918]
MSEIYWGIRLYELARGAGVIHSLYAGLEYASRLGNFDPKYRTGRLDGKGKPFPNPEDLSTLVFTVPLGDAKCPLIYLEDYGPYARWLFDYPARSSGLELHVATEDIAWKDLATAFTEVTGRKAVYKDVSLDEYFSLPIFPYPDNKVGHSANRNDPALITFRENFSGFWNTWEAELTKCDYKLLDEILQTRVKIVKEWMKKTGYNGKRSSLLKDHREGGRKSSSRCQLMGSASENMDFL